MKKYLILAIGCLMILCSILGYIIKSQKIENQRLTSNQEALLSENKIYKTDKGKYVAEVQELTLTCDELAKSNKFLTNSIADLNIKLKRVQAVSSAGSETKIEIHTIIKDSIVFVDKEQDTLQVFTWRDPWVNVKGKIHNHNLTMELSSNDTIVQVVHRIPKRFLFFRWGTKIIKQEMMSTNPHTKIVYSEYINVK